MARHKAAPQEALIRKTLAQYQALGYTYLRDGGDRWGAGALAAKLAPEYGIRYRTPCFPIYKTGHSGSFIRRGFSTPAEYRALVRAAKAAGAHFIKIMISGLMDFEHYGVLTDEPLAPGEIADMIAGAHDEGFSVMAHANGDSAVRAYTEKFDGRAPEQTEVSRKELEDCLQSCDPKFRQALQDAARNIRDFHERQKQQSWPNTRADGTARKSVA